MNLRTVLHLLRTDVRRMRLLISVTLALLTLNFALTLSANEWRAPAQRSSSMDNSWSLYGNSLRNVTEGSMLGAGVFAACLAGAAGWQGLAWSRTRPVRRREAAAAKVALLGGFLIGPQIIMVFTVLLRHGIPLREALLGTAAAAGVFVPLWIMLAALGRLAGSGAAFLAGLV